LGGFGVGSERRPVTFLFNVFVGNGTLDHQYERIDLAALGHVPVFHEVVADFGGEDGIVQMNFRQPGDRAEEDVLNARLRGGGNRYRIPVATQAGGDP